MTKEHKTNIIVTQAIIGSGKFYQAECSCGWLASRSHSSRYPAKKDAENHEVSQAN